MKPEIPPDEEQRLRALRRYDVLDTPPEPAFDRVSRMAARIFSVPMAFVSLVDAERQWFKSGIGLELCETSRDVSFCAHAILSEGLTVVPDTLADPRFADNPAVTGPPGIRFYAGAPLVSSDGHTLGMLCIADTVPRPCPDQVEVLAELAAIVSDELELRVAARRRAVTDAEARRLASIVESSSDAILAKGLDGTIRSWNRGAQQLYGWSAEEVVGRSVSVLLPGGREDEVPAILDRVRRGHRVEPYQTLRVRKDGTLVDVVLTVSPMLGVDGGVVGASVIARDVTEQRRAEETLRAQAASLEELSRLLDLTHDAVIVRRQDGTVGFWNEGAERIYGWSRADALGAVIHDLLATKFPTGREEVDQALERDGQWRGELVHTTRDGREVVVASRWALHTGTQGREAVLELNTDITERKAVEEALAAAKEEAERASRAKSEFLANMSHEIRTPMNGVIGMTGLLLTTELTAEQREYAETVRSSADALLNVINEILDFSKVEAGRMELEVIDFDLRTAVEDVADLLAERAHDKGLELLTLIGPGVPMAVQGDPGRLRQVLLNLVSNAVKFTEQGEVAVQVSVDHEDGDEVLLRLSVTDTGVGITPEHQERLFDPFSQADASTTRRYGGTGLGLAISKRLAELMGGDIGLTSEPGRGSTFWFTVPVRKGDAPAKTVHGWGDDLAGVRVLVVDDNETNRRILEETLGQWGLEAQSAPGAQRALTVLRSAAAGGQPFHVALLDYHMPEVDGLDLARAIRRDPALDDLRMVMLTSSGKRGDAALAREAGVQAFLTKPARLSALRTALRTVLDRSPQEASASPLVTRFTVAEADARARPRVLVVEDNPVNQKVAVRFLERLGYQPDVAGDGKEAVGAVARLPYDAVLMDCQMPEMDGYEATEAIRALPGGQGLPIIAMTAGAMTWERERCTAAGMDDFVAKPVRVEVLTEVLARWVRGERGSSGPEGPGAREDSPLDRQLLAQIQDLDASGTGEVFRELLELFRTHSRDQLVDLREAAAAGDGAAMKRIAHRLKGSASNIGAVAMAALCGKLEARAADDNVSAATVVRGIEAEFNRAEEALIAEARRNSVTRF